MTPQEEGQLETEIRRFGFLVPLVVREVVDEYEIVDGEHRWVVGRRLGLKTFPCWNLGVIDDDTAKQLTPILNELHGRPDDVALGELLKDLLVRVPEPELRELMPYERERFDELIGTLSVDWGALDRIGEESQDGQKRIGGTDRWVERVYRMPAEAAAVVDEAIEKALAESGATDAWRGLEFVAAEFMGR